MIKAVIFDLDDTLVAEFEFVKSGFKAVAKYLSSDFKVDNEENIYLKLMDFYEINRKNVFDSIIAYYDLSKLINVIKLINIYRNHFPILELYDDVLPTLVSLRKLNLKLGIITDGYKETQNNKIKSLRLYDLFDSIIVTDEFGKEFWKPSKLPFEMMQKKLELQFDEMLYVGDNPSKDFLISSIYPIKTTRIIRDGYYKDSLYLNNVKENYIIYSLKDITKIIDNLSK